MSMFYDKDEFQLSSNVELNEILTELPFDLIKESILEQINDPISSRTNYIDVILDKVRVFEAQYDEDEELLEELHEQINNFMLSIIHAIDDKFNLLIDYNEIASGNIIEIGECIYNYFVVRYVKNITRFITKYIFKNKKSISQSYGDAAKKDVSTLAFKKQIKNNDDLCIITNLPLIIKDIINTNLNSYEFISLSAGSSNYDASVVKGLIESFRLNGDFFRPYISICVDDHDYIIDELQTEIRIKILNKIS